MQDILVVVTALQKFIQSDRTFLFSVEFLKKINQVSFLFVSIVKLPFLLILDKIRCFLTLKMVLACCLCEFSSMGGFVDFPISS